MNQPGREAHSPKKIGKKAWKQVLLRVWDEYINDNIAVVAAGVAFFGFLAVFPALAATISLYGLIADPAQVAEQIEGFAAMLPQSAMELLEKQMEQLTARQAETLSWGLAVSVLFALWSSSKGMRALITALNIVYEEKEKRSLVRFYGLSLALTFGAIVAALLALGAIIAIPAILNIFKIGSATEWTLRIVRWPILFFLAIFSLAALDRFAPNRANARWRWITPGAIFASLTWVLVSGLFSLFVSNFGNFSATYGSVAAVAILMLWFLISANIILIGAEMNAELEHQTAHDTTTGPEQPMGDRGAYVADTVAPPRK